MDLIVAEEQLSSPGDKFVRAEVNQELVSTMLTFNTEAFFYTNKREEAESTFADSGLYRGLC